MIKKLKIKPNWQNIDYFQNHYQSFLFFSLIDIFVSKGNTNLLIVLIFSGFRFGVKAGLRRPVTNSEAGPETPRALRPVHPTHPVAIHPVIHPAIHPVIHLVVLHPETRARNEQ